MRHERRLFIALWLAVALLLSIGAASTPLLDPDEPRFARTSVEMLRSGDPIVPYYAGRPRLVKPPLLHWLQASLFGLFGPREWAARVPSILAVMSTIALVAHVVRRRFGGLAPVWAVVVMGSMPLVITLGRIGTLDALLTLHVFAVVALDLVGHPGRQRDFALGALLGLAFLVKGPVGVALPLLMLLAGRTATGAELVPAVGAVLRVLAALGAVLLPWLVAFVGRIGLDSAVAVVRHEAIDAYVVGTTHSKAAWFYVGVVVVGFLPWATALGVGLVRAWRSRRDPGARVALYAGAALLAGLVFFSLGRNKLANYLLPLAPLAAIVVTWSIGKELAAPHRRTASSQWTVATLGATAAVLGLAQGMLKEPGARDAVIAGAVIQAACAIVAGAAALLRRPGVVHAVAAGAGGALIASAIFWFLPGYSRERSLAEIVAAAPELRSAPAVLSVDNELPSLVYYLDRVPEWVEADALATRLDAADLPCLVIPRRDAARLPPTLIARLRPIGESGNALAYCERATQARP